MLTHLTLINFALADHLTIDISSGFNVLTGETGAGKSLLLDALSACLGERTDSQQIRYGADKADITAVFSYIKDSPEQVWLTHKELEDGSGELHLRRVIFSTGRSKAWINGRPTSLAELKELGQILVQLYSQHSQQQLLGQHYPKQWLDRSSGLLDTVQDVKSHYQAWQKAIRQYDDALHAQTTHQQRVQLLELQLEEIEPITAYHYPDIEQAFDRYSHHEAIMQDCNYSLDVLDDSEQNIAQQLASILKRIDTHAGRSDELAAINTALLNAQNEISEAASQLRQFIDHQSFDPERMAELNTQLEIFHRLARKHRVAPEDLKQQYETWQDELTQLNLLEDPETLALHVKQAEREFLTRAEKLDQMRQAAAPQLAKELTHQVKSLALPEAQFEFVFMPFEQPHAEGLSQVQLHFTANKGIPAQPLAKVASGGELSRIALVMQVMNAERTDADLIVFDEIDVGISGGTAEIVGRLLAKLGQHVQVLCITHQAQVAAQSDQHLLVQKQQTDPASSTIFELDEDQRIQELARMTGGIEINNITLEHAKQLRTLKYQQK
ncbi:DNA repair protein RecN [Acinetobacter apis]|uniref:DNA repair protein RecN n=1 Tax=Acinetobacter apis TaxID=1229165 RepID=A0A217EG94_9GAMM|nr:DNA repair protein RecN [Acinetobacter apis]SNQ29505.1 DNA replication and repair protein RecN [Acinetobacter apis]